MICMGSFRSFLLRKVADQAGDPCYSQIIPCALNLSPPIDSSPGYNIHSVHDDYRKASADTGKRK